MNQEKDFTTSIVIDKSAAEVFKAVNQVRGWWQGEITGESGKLDDEFTYRMPAIHFSRQKIVEWIPSEKVVWLVTESNLSFVNKKDEWTGTTIEFRIQPVGDKTQLIFTHHGLKPAFECYGGCSNGWTELIQKSLYSFISTGKGVDVF